MRARGALAALLLGALAARAAATDYRIVGYYGAWDAYARAFTPRSIDASRLTDIAYAFAAIVDGALALGDETVDPANFAELRRLRESKDTLRLLISVGGWNGSDAFSDIAASDAARRRFAASAVAFLRGHGFDGIDVDWEYPVAGGKPGNRHRPEDKQNFTLLLAALRGALDAAGAADGRRYLLTIAAGAAPGARAGIEPAAIAPLLDWISVMAYDHAGAWSPTSGHNAPLFADPADPAPDAARDSAAAAIDAYLAAGVPARKLLLGLPLYGRTWRGCAAADDGQYQACAGAAKGTWEDGVLDYRDIAANFLPRAGFVRRFNDAAKVPFLFAAASGQFISYEDPESLGHKAAFLKAKGLGGAMWWELSADPAGRLLGALARDLAPP